MKSKKLVLTDFNHLGATNFSTLRDPYFGNRCYSLWYTENKWTKNNICVWKINS